MESFGMDCNTCAIHIHKYLEKQGMQNVKVNFATGDVIFDAATDFEKSRLTMVLPIWAIPLSMMKMLFPKKIRSKKKCFSFHPSATFSFCLPFTALLMLHMIPRLHIHWLMNHWVQLALATPVYIVGMSFLDAAH
jgi:Cu+-exporting ATPase